MEIDGLFTRAFFGQTGNLFVLAEESKADRDEIEDVAGEFDALLLGIETKHVKFDVHITVNAEPLPMLDMVSWRMVFRRKEI